MGNDLTGVICKEMHETFSSTRLESGFRVCLFFVVLWSIYSSHFITSYSKFEFNIHGCLHMTSFYLGEHTLKNGRMPLGVSAVKTAAHLIASQLGNNSVFINQHKFGVRTS